MTDKIIVFSTCQTREEAEKVARMLVESRLAACVNIVPGVASFYWWQDKIEESAEVMLIIKSRRDLIPQLEKNLAKVHSYQVPELIAISIVEGSRRYVEWLDRELQPPTEP